MKTTFIGGTLAALGGVLSVVLRVLLDHVVWLDSLVLYPVRSVVQAAFGYDILFEGTCMTAWLYGSTVVVFFALGVVSTKAWLLRGHDDATSIRRTLRCVAAAEFIASAFHVVV